MVDFVIHVPLLEPPNPLLEIDVIDSKFWDWEKQLRLYAKYHSLIGLLTGDEPLIRKKPRVEDMDYDDEDRDEIRLELTRYEVARWQQARADYDEQQPKIKQLVQVILSSIPRQIARDIVVRYGSSDPPQILDHLRCIYYVAGRS